MCTLFFIHYRYHDALKRLADFDVHLAAQCQYHGSDVLCHLHADFQFLVYHFLLIFGELGKVYGNHIVASRSCNQVGIEHISIERSDGCHQLSHGFEACIECLECRELVLRHTTAPETFAVQADIPVGEVVVHEFGNETSCFRGLVFIVAGIHVLHQRIQYRENPTVYLRAFCHGHIGFFVVKFVYIGIEGEE